MGYIIRMPQMGMEMDEGEVVEWVRGEGEEAEAGDTVAVVESEKATNEVEAREDGVVRRTLVEEGGAVEPGTPIGILAGPDEDLSEYEAEIDADGDGPQQVATAAGGAGNAGNAGDGTARETGGGTASAAAAGAARDAGGSATSEGSGDSADVRATPGARQLAEEEGVDLSALEGTGPQGVVTEDDVTDHARGQADAGGAESGGAADVQASPGARQLAEERGVDLSAVEGTGPQGVIIEDDVEAHLERAPAAGATAGAATRTVSEVRDLSGIQQTVGERLADSYRNAVHVTVKREFDAGTMQDVVAAAETAGVDVSPSDLLVKAVAATMAAHPEFNALYEDGEHRLIEEVNVGVAVDVDGGLVTPVVPAAGEKSVEEVAAVRGELTERALAGEFTTDDLAGGTVTITNLGMFGVDSFDPVINPPETAILGVGRIRDDGRMTLSLSFDHRAVNGADGARFLDELVGTLTDLGALVGFFEADLL